MLEEVAALTGADVELVIGVDYAGVLAEPRAPAGGSSSTEADTDTGGGSSPPADASGGGEPADAPATTTTTISPAEEACTG